MRKFPFRTVLFGAGAVLFVTSWITEGREARALRDRIRYAVLEDLYQQQQENKSA